MFSKKSIRVLIQKKQGEFKEGVNTLEFKNLPIEATIQHNGSLAMSNIKIYGISKEHINSITRLPLLSIVQEQDLKLALYVDDGAGEFLLYVGGIRCADPNYTNAPDVYIDIHCITLAFQNLMGSIPPTSFDGEARVPDMYRAVCASYNVPFYDRTIGDFKAQKPPVLNQPSMSARLNVLQDAYRDIVWKDHNERVYIYTRGSEVLKYTFTPKDYIGYPSFTQTGIGLRFDKIISFKPNEKIEVKDSELEMINHEWFISSVVYNISTKIDGRWEMEVKCYKGGND